jgi:hypothetical protein
MPVTNAIILAQATTTIAQFEAGSGDPVLEIRTAGYGTLLLSYTLDDGFQAASIEGGLAVVVADELPKVAAAAASGTAGSFQLRDGDGDVVWQETGAGAVGTDPQTAIAVLTDTAITEDEETTLQSLALGISPVVLPGLEV